MTVLVMDAKASSLRLELFAGAIIPLTAILIITIFRFGLIDGLLSATLFIVSLLAHEAGHAAMAQLTGTKFSAIGFCWKGAYIRRQRSWGIREFLISLSGPMVNILLAVALWNAGGILTWLAQMNAILAVVNLIPFRGSDGQRIMSLARGWLSQLNSNTAA